MDLYLQFFKFIFERDRESKWGKCRERQGKRQNPKEAPYCQHRARCGTHNHEP